MKFKIIICTASMLLYSSGVFAQSGGSFEIKQSVTGNGGGRASGGQFFLNATIGETVAGTTSTGGSFSNLGGFWSFSSGAPTAASVSISGKVTDFAGQGIMRARVTLTDMKGNARLARTSSFGYYRFDEVQIGETYIVTVSHKEFSFVPQVILTNEELTDLNFTGQPQ